MIYNKIILIVSFLLITIAKINAQYVPEWVSKYPLGITTNYSYKNVVIDQSDNYYFACGSSSIIFKTYLYKFNSIGQFQWVRTYNGFGNDTLTIPVRILHSPDNYIYLIGINGNFSFNSGNIFIYKFDASGNVINLIEYKYPGSIITSATDAVIDNNSNIYVTGKITKNTLYHDSILTAKFSSNCNLVWVKTYADSLFNDNNGRSIKLDNDNNVYVAGQLYVPNFYYDVATIKYNSNGNLIWLQKYHHNNNNSFSSESPFDICVDNNQNVIITGYAEYINGWDSNYTLVLKYNNVGQFAWGNIYNLSNNDYESGFKILYNNDIYIQTSTYPGTKLLKINNNGSLLWNTTIPGDASYCNFDYFNYIICAGYQSTSFNKPLSIVRVNPSGVITQNYLYSYNGTGTDVGFYIKSYSDSKLSVLGIHASDLLFLKLTPANTYNIGYSRHNLNKSINDSNYTYDTITFNQTELPLNAFVKDVNITIDTILHPSAGDLEISLIHNGFNDTLVYRRGGPFANFISTHLDDTSSNSICSYGQAPYSGYFKPCNPLAKFNYLTAEGPWILRIYDRKAPATGVLKAWSLNITYDATSIGIKPISTEIPDKFSLSQNYPNPFNPTTKIRFQIPNPKSETNSKAEIRIYDLLGKEVAVLVNEELRPGIYEVEWDATAYASGVYFYTLTTSDPFYEPSGSKNRGSAPLRITKKMVLIK